jgi:hypothetical protein
MLGGLGLLLLLGKGRRSAQPSEVDGVAASPGRRSSSGVLTGLVLGFILCAGVVYYASNGQPKRQFVAPATSESSAGSDVVVEATPVEAAPAEQEMAAVEASADQAPEPSPAATSAPPTDPRTRTWVSAKGQHQINATFISATAGVVTLESEDGKRVKVPIDRLSADDQEFIRRLGR